MWSIEGHKKQGNRKIDGKDRRGKKGKEGVSEGRKLQGLLCSHKS